MTSPSSSDPAAKTRLLRRAIAATPIWMPTHGSSMGRTIPPGAAVRVVPASRARRGQVWAYCDDDGRVVVHRYVRAENGSHILRGDASAVYDPPVGSDRIIGKVVAVRRDGRDRRVRSAFRIRGVVQRARRFARAYEPAMARRYRQRRSSTSRA
jgi:hypothetical protein